MGFTNNTGLQVLGWAVLSVNKKFRCVCPDKKSKNMFYKYILRIVVSIKYRMFAPEVLRLHFKIYAYKRI
jgi:hypothetical protein